jgi:hypothetical protein
MPVLQRIRDEWRAFSDAPPGERFRAHYQRSQANRGRAGRVALVGAGIVLLVVGLAMLVLPGPGIIVSAGGLALLAQQSALLARGLDRAEVAVRRVTDALGRWWRRRSTPARVGVATFAASLAALAAVGMWHVVF